MAGSLTLEAGRGSSLRIKKGDDHVEWWWNTEGEQRGFVRNERIGEREALKKGL